MSFVLAMPEVLGSAATDLAALGSVLGAADAAAASTEPRAARSVAADPNTSGIASTNDMCHLPPESAGQRPRHPR
ncbi:hypothetical protein [Mycobacterium tuberculosis]|uniref:hypothetical protein n=1 Tax=Mycobacterium tuberculosis TaxID=1773 RepID=UPI002350906E|nr:hypothetical protein [Mycobacterium tuberculosis]